MVIESVRADQKIDIVKLQVCAYEMQGGFCLLSGCGTARQRVSYYRLADRRAISPAFFFVVAHAIMNYIQRPGADMMPRQNGLFRICVTTGIH